MPCRIIQRGFLALTLTLGGCIGTGGIAPQNHEIHAEQLATGDAVRAAAVDAHWPASQWWQVYADPQLNGWMTQALANSPALAVAAARVREAQAMAGVAEAAESVQIGGDAAIRRHKWPTDDFYGPGTLADTSTFDNTATLGLSYPLDFWGRDSNASARALDLAHMSAAQARMAELDLQGNIVRAYIQFSLQYAQRDIAEATLAQQQQILDLAQKRLQGGIGTHFEVSQAEAPLPETRRQIDALDEEIALSRNQLAALAGKGPGEGERLQRPSLSLGRPLALPSSLPAQLLGQRPDVVASRWRVAAQARGIDVAQAGFYPNIDLAASFGFMAVGGGALEFLAARKLSGTVGPALSLPIFDGGRLRAELGEASGGYDAAVAQYNQTLVDALKNIADQLIRRASLDKQQALAGESVAAANKTYQIALVAYQRGLTDYLNVLNAQSLLFRQQQVQQQVQAARLSVQAGLIIALGGGLGAGADVPADASRLPSEPPLAALRR